MRKSSIYVDTSVIGGCCDPEFQEWSNGLLADVKAGYLSLLLSELSDAEVEDAPGEVRKIYLEFRNCANRILDLSPEAIELADAYLTAFCQRNIVTMHDTSHSQLLLVQMF